METNDLVEKIVDVSDAFKANDCQILEVAELCGFADFFVIMSGNSTVHIQAIAEELILRTKHAGRPATNIEGLAKGEWVLIDYGDVVVHLMSVEKRSFYDLESLWRRQAEVETGEPIATEER